MSDYSGYRLTKENADALWAKVAENRKTLQGLKVAVRVIGGLPNGVEENRLTAELERLVVEQAPLVGDADRVFSSGEFDLGIYLNQACENIGIASGLHQATISHRGRELRA